MARTFYDVLDLEEDADSTEIRQRFRDKAKEHHPDVSDHPDASERFKRINRAAEVLGDPVERKRYDHLGHDAYVASYGGPGADGESRPTGAGGGQTATADGNATATNGSRDSGGATGGPWRDTATDSEAGPAGPWDGDDGGNQDATDAADASTAESSASSDADAADDSDGPWTGFRDVDGPGRASAGGSIGRGSAYSDPERTARWERAHDTDPVDQDRASEAWDQRGRPPARNAWLVTLSMIGSGRIVDQWEAFRRGLLLVYLYPVLLAVLLAQLSAPITIAVAAVMVFVAIYGSGIPNVGAFVFGLLGGLITVYLVPSPYGLSSPTARVVLAACWLPLGHSVLVVWLLHRSRD